MLIRCGYVRDQPRGSVQPWKLTMIWKSAASLRSSWYNWMMFCLSLCQKSTLTPLIPHFLSVANSSRRISLLSIRPRGFSETWLCGPPELYHSSRPTPLPLA